MAVDRKTPQTLALTASRRAAAIALESIAALALCFGALAFVHPVALSQLRTHLYSMSIDIYRIGDFGGTLFLVSRAATGESGDRTRLIGAPASFRLTDDFPKGL